MGSPSSTGSFHQPNSQLSFAQFLARCTILSDDPQDPKPIPFVPYDYQRERIEAWDSRQSEVILKARQLGFSWLAAAYAAYRASQGWAAGIFSKGDRESKQQLRRCKHVARSAGLAFDGNESVIRFAGGGSIEAFPSTENAGISYTFQLIIADEAAAHPYGADNYAAYRPALSAGGQYLAISTANPRLGPSGFFYELYQQAVAGEVPYAPVFVPWDARPGRDDEWLARERAAYRGHPEEFDAYYPESAAAAFVGKSGLVFPQFSLERHVREGDPVPWEECRRRYYGTDYGGGDPTAIPLLGIYRTSAGPRAHVYACYHRKAGAPTIDDLAGFLGPWHARSRFTTGEGDPAPGGEVINESLRALGFPCRRANAARGEGLGLVAEWLEKGWLTFNGATCKPLIAEFAGYRWAERTDPHSKERYATDTPVDHHADALDALRYALMGAWFDEMNGRAKGGFAKAFSGVSW